MTNQYKNEKTKTVVVNVEMTGSDQVQEWKPWKSESH